MASLSLLTESLVALCCVGQTERWAVSCRSSVCAVPLVLCTPLPCLISNMLCACDRGSRSIRSVGFDCIQQSACAGLPALTSPEVSNLVLSIPRYHAFSFSLSCCFPSLFCVYVCDCSVLWYAARHSGVRGTVLSASRVCVCSGRAFALAIGHALRPTHSTYRITLLVVCVFVCVVHAKNFCWCTLLLDLGSGRLAVGGDCVVLLLLTANRSASSAS